MEAVCDTWRSTRRDVTGSDVPVPVQNQTELASRGGIGRRGMPRIGVLRLGEDRKGNVGQQGDGGQMNRQVPLPQ